eukprot:5703229-Pleurochrysis_carterae.AAC.1
MSIFEAILASSSLSAAAAAASTAGYEGSYTALAAASEHTPWIQTRTLTTFVSAGRVTGYVVK